MSEISVIERLFRRAVSIVSRGRLTLVDDSQACQLVQVKFKKDDVRDKLPRVQDFGMTSVPLPGADAIILFVAGERSNGVVIGVNDQGLRPKNLQPGDVCLYDSRGRYVRINASGIFVEGGDGTIYAHTTGSVLVSAEGDITAAGSGRLVVNTTSAVFNCPVTYNHAVTFSSTVTAGGKDIGGTHEHSGGTISGHTGPPL